MRFLRILKQRIFADIRKFVDAPSHDIDIFVGKPIVDSLGAVRRSFVLRVDGKNVVRKLFFANSVFLEADLECWQIAPSKNPEYIFLPEYGRPVLINTDTLEKILLPDQVMIGKFLGNIFYGKYLLIFYSGSVMVIYPESLVSACYTFDFELTDAKMLDTDTLLITKKDGSVVKFDRNNYSFF